MIPEKIIAFKQDDKVLQQWNLSLKKVLQTVAERKHIDSDAFDGSFVRNFEDNQIHYYFDPKPEIDEDGFVKSKSFGVEQFKGYMYLVKWTDLPYQCCTWELHEDLAASPYIGEDNLKQLRKSYNNAPKNIVKMLQQPDVCKFGSRKAF
jgi:hypothetical protein